MAVAAAILAAHPQSALDDVGGVPAARALAIAADEGGAGPVMVVGPDPDGSVAAAVQDVAELVSPASEDGGPVAGMARGIDAARELDETTAAVLLWPADVTWADEWLVRALIAAQSHHRPAIVRPMHDGVPDWPALFPVVFRSKLDGIAADRTPDEILADVASAGVPTLVIPVRPSA